ncbi:MAG: hypothetical protein CMJ16_04500 [Peredibacter sp.]|nr:hypothetical protein [Peredibacter sp.]
MKFLLLFLMFLTLKSFSADEFVVVELGYIRASERIDDYTKKFVANLNKVLKQHKYVVKAVPLPSVRDLHNSNEGMIHGALSRSNLVDNSVYPNLKLIETPVALLKYQLNKKKSKKLPKDRSLIRLVCIRDDRLCKGMLGKGFRVVEVNTHKAQSLMLKSDRVELVMRVNLKATGIREDLLVPKLEGLQLESFNEPYVVNTYTYINSKKFPKIYKALSDAYKTLKAKEWQPSNP